MKPRVSTHREKNEPGGGILRVRAPNCCDANGLSPALSEHLWMTDEW